MEFGSAFPTDGEPPELVKEGKGLLDEVAELAQAVDVRGALAGDDGQDPALAELSAVGVGVVSFVAEQRLGAAAWTSGAASNGWDAVRPVQGSG